MHPNICECMDVNYAKKSEKSKFPHHSITNHDIMIQNKIVPNRHMYVKCQSPVTWLQNNIAKVRYDGNDKVYNEEASDYCLLRCAEVTKEKGFRYFTIIEQSNQPRSSSEPSSIRIIRVANEQPQNGPIAYEVDFLIKSLKEKYNLD